MSAIFDKNGARSVCWECRKVHAAKDCPRAKAQRRRKSAREDRWLAEMIQLRDQIEMRRAAQA